MHWPIWLLWLSLLLLFVSQVDFVYHEIVEKIIASSFQLSSQRKRPGTPKPKTAAAVEVVTQKTYRPAMEDEVSNSNGNLDQIHRAIGSARRKPQIDGVVERLRRTATSESLQIAKLDCKDAPLLQPLKSKRAPPRKSLSDVSEHCLPTPRAAMTFEELNGLFKQSTKQQGMDKSIL